MPKITTITPTGEMNGDYHVNSFTLDDNKNGFCQSKNPTPTLKVGDDVTINKTWVYDQKTFCSLSKIQTEGGGGQGGYSGSSGVSSKTSGYDSTGAMIGNAINNAVLLYIDQEGKYDGKQFKTFLWKRTQEICNCSLELKKKYNKPKEEAVPPAQTTPAPQAVAAQPVATQATDPHWNNPPQVETPPPQEYHLEEHPGDEEDVPF